MPCARLCRVAWADGDRDDLFAWLRLAGSTWDASRAHDSEARLRVRSITEAGAAERELLAAEPPRVVPELTALRGGERSRRGAAHAGRCRALARLRQRSGPRRDAGGHGGAPRARGGLRHRGRAVPRQSRRPTATTCWRRWMPCRCASATGCRGGASASSASAWPGSRPYARWCCAGSRRACFRAGSPPRPRARPSCGARSRLPACRVTGRGRRSAIASCSRRPSRASTSISRSCAARPTTTASSSLPRPSGTRSCACSGTRRRSP